ncbi:MAG: helix-turn-helix transcriptional regulator, partial [Oscillospiraceae bacterium]|nr:helix-turn-helix transcriptional regulator [Oscillospiraceae bacterium]
MNSNFPRLLSLLRKERGISQKNAAKELGVSQALLSHYEKGIRECGLSFVVRAADFYDVSCDYLLGRSPERQGTTLSAEDLHDPYNQKEMPTPKTLKAVYNKKLLFCSLNILFDILSKVGNSNIMDEISNFLCLSVYRMLRVVFRISKKNQDEMFIVADPIANQQAQA